MYAIKLEFILDEQTDGCGIYVDVVAAAITVVLSAIATTVHSKHPSASK